MDVSLACVFWFVLFLGWKKASKFKEKKKKKGGGREEKVTTRENSMFFTSQLDSCQLLEEGLHSQIPAFSHGMHGHLERKE